MLDRAENAAGDFDFGAAQRSDELAGRIENFYGALVRADRR